MGRINIGVFDDHNGLPFSGVAGFEQGSEIIDFGQVSGGHRFHRVAAR